MSDDVEIQKSEGAVPTVEDQVTPSTDTDNVRSEAPLVDIVQTNRNKEQTTEAPLSTLDIVENHYDKQNTIVKKAVVSAPAREIVLDNEQDVAETIVNRPVMIKEEFRPLTLEQLKSLYYNVMLENNAAYIDRFVQVR